MKLKDVPKALDLDMARQGPERMLFAAMVFRAAWDLSSEDRKHRKSSRTWFLMGCVGRITFDDCCVELGIDGRALIEHLAKLGQFPESEWERPPSILRYLRMGKTLR